MRILATLAAIAALTTAAQAQPFVNLTGRGLIAAATGGGSVGQACSSTTVCTPFVLNATGAGSFRTTESGGLNNPFVLFAGAPPFACPAIMPPLGTLIFRSPILLAAGNMSLGVLGTGCPGAAQQTFPTLPGATIYLQSVQLTPGNLLGYTTPIRINM